ncbi:MAG TPA: DoxX family protein [Paraburkholderia sp.]
MNRSPSLLRYFNPSWLSSHLASMAPLPVRLIIGYGFIAHGCAKIAKNPDHFAAILHALGVPFPHLMAWATIAVELGGGLAILLGAFVPLITIPMIVVLLVATFTVHVQFGFTSIKLMSVANGVPQFGPPGYETDLLYIAGLMTLVFAGSGPFAVDAVLKPFYARWAAFAQRV